MAQPANNPDRPGAADILKLLAPYPGRAAITFRVALICALTVFVTSTFGTMEAAISAYVVFFLIQPDRVLSVVQSAALMFLITPVIGLVIVVCMFALDEPVWRVACIAGLSFALLFVTSASKLRPVGAILALVVGLLLDELGSVPFGEVATRALLYSWLMLAIPIGVSICVNVLLAPSPRRVASRALAERLRLAARALAASGLDTSPSALSACLQEGDARIVTWLKLSVADGSSAREDFPPLRQAVSSTFAILVAASLAAREASARLPPSFAEPIARTLEDMANVFDAGGYPIDIEPGLPNTEALTPLARIVADELHRAITGFAVARNEPAGLAPDSKSGGFFLPGAFTNPEHIRYALKTTAAAMFCYLLYSQINWPGIHTCFITVYMVSLGTTAETVEKMTLRIAGCVVGSILGTLMIIFVMPVTTTIFGLMGIVFVGAWLAAWIAFGSPRIAYAGFQIALVFFMCVIQGAAPAFDLTLARDRTIGILVGNLVVYLIFTRAWPVSVAARVDTGLNALRQRWKTIALLANSATRSGQIASAIAQRGALMQDLAMMHYEPAWVRPDRQWIDARRHALDQLDALETPMFLLAENHGAIDGWIGRISGETGTVATLPTSSTNAALLNLGNARLAELERVTSHAPA